MRKRQITTVEWSEHYETNVSTGMPFYPKRHVLTGLVIVSGFNRMAQIEVRFARPSFAKPWIDYMEPIELRLRKVDKLINLRYKEDGDGQCFLSFLLTLRFDKEEEFCDAAIRISRLIMDTLGVRNIPELFCQFNIRQETEVYLRGSWVSFADHIRLKHGLPLSSDL